MTSDIDRLDQVLNALVYRVQKLEAKPGLLPECCQAKLIATELGLSAEIVCGSEPAWNADRARLMRELRRRGWTVALIARGLRCCERTVQRAVAGEA